MFKKISFIIFMVLLTGGLFLVSGYFFLNLFFIPKKLIPQIEASLTSILKRPADIRSIYLTPKGSIIILKPALYNPNETGAFFSCSSINISIAYGILLKSWRENKNYFDIPVHLKLNGISLNQNPVSITGEIAADFCLKINTQDIKNFDWQGEAKIKNFSLTHIPLIGDIKDITGTVKISRDEISSSDIRGQTNNAPVNLSLRLVDFSMPELKLKIELSKLLVTLDCIIDPKGSINFKTIEAKYNKIKSFACGKITDLQSSPHINITSNTILNLQDLAALPLNIKDTFTLLNSKGDVRITVDLAGPLQNTSELNAKATISSEAVSLLNYNFENLTFNLKLDAGKIATADLVFNWMQNTIKAWADCDLTSNAWPYALKIILNDLRIEDLQSLTPKSMDIEGELDIDLTVKGEASNLKSVNIELENVLKNLKYQGLSFPDPIKTSFMIDVLDFKNLILKKVSVANKLLSLDLDGKITNLIFPNLSLNGKLTLAAENLYLYPAFKLPPRLTLQGTVLAGFKLTGPVKAPDKLTCDFQAASSSFNIGEFSLTDIILKGAFSDNALNISSFLVKIFDGNMLGNGRINLAEPDKTTYKLNLELKDLDISKIARQIKSAPQELAGRFSSTLNMSGQGLNLDTLNFAGNLKSKLAQAKVKGTPIDKAGLEADLKYERQKIAWTNLCIGYKDITIYSEGSISALLENPLVELSLKSTINLADIENLPFSFDFDFKQLNPQGALDLTLGANGPLKSPEELQITASLLADKFSIKDILFTDTDIAAKLHNKLLETKAKSTAYSGQLSAELNATLLNKTCTYDGTFRIEKLDFGKLIEESKIVPQPHKGIFSLDTTFAGEGAALDKLTGNARAQIIDARLSGLELLQSIGTLTGIGFLSNFNVTKGNGTYVLGNGLVSTEDTELSGPDANIQARGNVDFKQNLNMNMKLILTPNAAQQTRPEVLENFFAYENNQYYTEVDIKGTLSKPKPDLNKFVQERVKQRVQKEVKKAIFKQLEGIFKK
ncbi:MAG: hypothetical protein KKB82_06215 [Candidatus Omnitrophica bacterium]|nr:hypothetical protein [Candidatus Omnitrophota bacterium]